MPPTEVGTLNRQVIVANPQHLARHTIEEAAEAAERQADRARQWYHAAHVVARQQLDSQFETQMEVDAHYIEGVGAAWGAAACRLPPPPRFMDVQEFIAEASTVGATVLLALDDSSTATGDLQQHLEAAGVGYTGPSADFAITHSSRLALSKAIDDIINEAGAEDAVAGAAAELHRSQAEGAAESDAATAAEPAAPADEGSAPAIGLINMPRKVIKTAELLGYLKTPEELEDVFETLKADWESISICIKPPARSGGMGVVRLFNAKDLGILANTMQKRLPRIPAGTLSSQLQAITLPLHIPDIMVLEPWIDTDPVTVVQQQGGQVEVQWAGQSRWVEVYVGLLGELGQMYALSPTLIAFGENGHRHHFTPAPEGILPPWAAEAAQGFSEALAVSLGLRSVAAVEGFVNVDTGELIVLDVQHRPSLDDGSPILQQVWLCVGI
eukprot:GHRR01026026.1.p1 GENE.GHRR01026026.1~~GHRR01026026.1.p1  ORF type:complete len:513 (+),score=189.73 GHRR01026026.1:217-1539(+)